MNEALETSIVEESVVTTGARFLLEPSSATVGPTARCTIIIGLERERERKIDQSIDRGRRQTEMERDRNIGERQKMEKWWV